MADERPFRHGTLEPFRGNADRFPEFPLLSAARLFPENPLQLWNERGVLETSNGERVWFTDLGGEPTGTFELRVLKDH